MSVPCSTMKTVCMVRSRVKSIAEGKRALSNAHIEGNRMRSKAYLPWALARQSSRSDIQASRAHSTIVGSLS